MKFGFQSAILADLSFEEVVDFASENGFECVEIMCWPVGQADRKYAGVTHLDVTNFTKADAEKALGYCEKKGVSISALGYYPNLLSPDAEEAETSLNHLKKVIEASHLMGLDLVTTFVGNDWTKSVEDNWSRFLEVWKPLMQFAEERGVFIAIENCAMYFTDDEWPAGKNLAYSPAIWRRMFKDLSSDYFGLNYDPSHLIWMQMDHLKPLKEFNKRFFHAHAKDVKVDREKLDDVGTMAVPLSYHDPRIPGRGDIDWKEYVAALKASGFNGAFCIEVEDSDYESSLDERKRALTESGAFLRQYL
ncbi:sugar phosphate isomerase/epimerase family protein [Kordiimonas lacus]|uniref:Sugar phosphate isomerase/epimerase n=1 Tax=Kordiimonas lacus TaxID=637679 RepID=A0A1G6SW13_9PROT|nr:sugar phosphate isomerase/epimerase family protein [Kordiimonas lacus]SDD21140.1 Sugar phosphate isomerase/epimerase [Kordiimonas lacus]